MGFAPFKLNYGYLPTLIGGITPTENAKPGVHKFINQVINNLEEAHDAESCLTDSTGEQASQG